MAIDDRYAATAACTKSSNAKGNLGVSARNGATTCSQMPSLAAIHCHALVGLLTPELSQNRAFSLAVPVPGGNNRQWLSQTISRLVLDYSGGAFPDSAHAFASARTGVPC